MSNAVYANGETAKPLSSNIVDEQTSNLSSSRDHHVEKIINGHYQEAKSGLTEAEAHADRSVVIRDGSYVKAGVFQPTDIVTVNGMQMPYEAAVGHGFIDANDPNVTPEVRPQEAPESPSEQPTAVSDLNLFNMQVEAAMGDNTDSVMSTFESDIITNGELSDEGLQFAQNNLGMNPEVIDKMYTDITVAGSQVLGGFLEVGDGLGAERLEWAADKAWNGTQAEQRTLRKMWIDAAKGKLTQESATHIFDELYSEYE